MKSQRQLPTTKGSASAAARSRTAAATACTGSRVLVVGAGVGGLTCAAELAARGHEVLVLERADAPGGKLREVEIDGFRLDAGPTVLTMRWVFDELFADLGTRLDEHLTLRPTETLARHAWSADERLDLFADSERSADAIGRFAGAAEARGYRAFCSRAAAIYRTLDAPFLRGARPTPLSLAARVGWRGLPELMRISPFATLASALGEHFRDPRLLQLFGRYATYCGSSPYRAPATLMLVAHVEREGVWLVEGGMHAVAKSLAGLVTRAGGSIRYGTHVKEVTVSAGRAAGVVLENGEAIAAAAVVFNGDVGALGGGLLGGGSVGRAVVALPASRRSLSALTWNLVAGCDGFPLVRHNVFFAADYREEFEALFGRRCLPAEPTVYVCAQDRGESSAAPTAGNHERLLCIVNAPAVGDAVPIAAQEITRCEERMTALLARCGLGLATTAERTVVTTPSDFARLFPGSGGAIYGQASHGWAASFSRPGARSRLPGLYLAGGTVHPGPGVPMAALSGRQAAASLLADRAADRASTARSPPPATRGGMSTP